MYKYKSFLLAVLTGVLLGLAFPPIPFYYLAFVAFVPLIYSLELRNNEKFFLMLYTTFFVYCGISNWWVGSWQSDSDPFLMASGIALSIVHPFFFLVPMYAYIFVRRKFGLNIALWLFPFIWVAFEWLHSLTDLSYPWLNVGYTQVYNLLFLQTADIAGVLGISFLIVLINTIVIRFIFAYIGLKNSNSELSIFKFQQTRNLIFVMLLLLIFPYIYGIIRLNDYHHEDFIKNNRNLKIGIVQPNINPWLKWNKSVLEQVVQHIKLQDSLISKVPDIDMFLWSETAIPFFDFSMNSDHNFSFLQRWVDKKNIPILTGFSDIYLYRKNEEPSVTAKKVGNTEIFYDSFNSSILLDTIKNEKPRIYHKMKLTPFSENLPFVETFPFLRTWIEWGVGISSWKKGEEQKNLQLIRSKDTIDIASIICIESIYPDFVRGFTSLGADFFVIITNDAWYNYTFGPEQHFVIARMRAVESRRYIARCANSGKSGFISASGEEYDILPPYQTISSYGKVALNDEMTIYANFGDYIGYLSTFLSLIFIIYGFFIRKNS